MSDIERLEQFAANGSQEAFAELFSEHRDWIFSVGLRQVRRRDWAEDVTQAVFILLSQKAATLKAEKLNAWLFNVTRYCSLSLLRSERRREKREREAAMMNPTISDADQDAVWNSMSLMLEETVRRLGARDREVILLRFYQKKGMAQVGAAVGISSEAARKRVSKAVERLRDLLCAKGARLPAAGTVAFILDQRTTHAAPLSLTAPSPLSPPSAAAKHIALGVNRMILAIKIKILAVMLLLAALSSASWFALHAQVVSPASDLGAVPNPVPTAATVAPATAPNLTVGDDEILSPFFNTFTMMVVSVDLSKLDLAAVAKEERSVLLGVLPANDARRSSIERVASVRGNDLGRAFSSMKRAGVGRVDTVIAGPPGGGAAGFFVVPNGPNAGRTALDGLFQTSGEDSPNGQARIYSGKRSVDVHSFLNQMEAADANPEISEALSAGPAQTVRIVLVPRVLDHTGSFARLLGLGNFPDPLWGEVQWLRVGLDVSPGLSADVTIDCKDEACASALAKMLGEEFAERAKASPSDPLEARIAALLANVKPAAAGSRVTVHFDREIAEAIFAVWYWRDIESGGSLGNLSIAQTSAPADPTLPHFTADQLKELTGMAGKTVVVEGTVLKCGDIQPRVRAIQFEGTEPDGFFAAADQDNAPDGYDYLGSVGAVRLAHKKVRVSGEVFIYKGRPMILISDLHQLVQVMAPAGN